MRPLTPSQRRRRRALERAIGLAAPALDAVLWVGDRISRIAEREDSGHEPPRPPGPDSPVRRFERRVPS